MTHSRVAKDEKAPTAVKEGRDDGFSLLEMLVVLAIMGIIAAMVAPRLFNQVDKSKQTVAEAQTKALITALSTMRLDIGRYPTADESLNLLIQRPTDPAAAATWYGPYMDDGLPTDPWGQPYRYTPPLKDAGGLDRTPFVYSLGADQQPGGSGLDTDIGRVPSGP
ncbi:MAG: type II secretion system major pseudopilin GspG [Alphaproteobacteria bacterium]|nr:type II secretion system major pseudopilin GspG [Alphaproteobacteria bacterium]